MVTHLTYNEKEYIWEALLVTYNVYLRQGFCITVISGDQEFSVLNAMTTVLTTAPCLDWVSASQYCGLIEWNTFRLDKSVPTTTLPPLVPRSTRLLRRSHTTLTKYNLLSSITIHRLPSSNRARRYQQTHLPTSGWSPDSALAAFADKKPLGSTSSSCCIVIFVTNNQKSSPRATI